MPFPREFKSHTHICYRVVNHAVTVMCGLLYFAQRNETKRNETERNETRNLRVRYAKM